MTFQTPIGRAVSYSGVSGITGITTVSSTSNSSKKNKSTPHTTIKSRSHNNSGRKLPERSYSLETSHDSFVNYSSVSGITGITVSSASHRNTKPSGNAAKSQSHDNVDDSLKLSENSDGAQKHLVPKLTWSQIQEHGRIGTGGFCMVLKVTTDVYKDRMVALKCLSEGEMDSTEREIAQMDLAREARLMSRISHPNIVKLLGLGVVDSTADDESSSLSSGGDNQRRRYNFLLLDLLEDTLKNRLDFWRISSHSFRIKATNVPRSIPKRPPNLYDRLEGVGLKLSNAMDYLHSKKLVHCDLKPANIGFDSQGEMKLFDFGLARDLQKGPASSNCIVGSYRYMAPEIIRGEPVTTQSDVYSFGIVLWELVVLVETPYKQYRTVEEFKRKVSERQERPSFEKVESCQLQELLHDSWQDDQTKRPSFTQIQERLKKIMVEEQEMLRSSGISVAQSSFRRNLNRASSFGFPSSISSSNHSHSSQRAEGRVRSNSLNEHSGSQSTSKTAS